jgi:predicted hydrocarbon binding protein
MREALEQNGGFFLPFDSFAKMAEALEATFGSGAKVIIGTMAKPCGQLLCKEIMEKSASKEEALNKLCELVNTYNWGELSFINFDLNKGSGRAMVKNSFETRQRQSKAPCCHFFANFIAGFISELFTKNVIVKEVSCAGKGDDYCEFRF